MIKVGVFWYSSLLSTEIIYDTEVYDEPIRCEAGLLTYSKQHKDVWDRLAAEQLCGKYASCAYNTLPRGRVWYDADEGNYTVVFYRGSEDMVRRVAPIITELFGIEGATVKIGDKTIVPDV